MGVTMGVTKSFKCNGNCGKLIECGIHGDVPKDWVTEDSNGGWDHMHYCPECYPTILEKREVARIRKLKEKGFKESKGEEHF